MVVDLTYTHKYYDGNKEFESEGVEYLKIMTQGGGTEPPKKPDLEQFAKKVTEFFKAKPDELCAVHCTHGINRSGFFIVSFLVEHCKVRVRDALASFAAARAPGIWDQLFIDELFARYGKGQKAGPKDYPPIPPWSKEKRRRDYDERRRKIIDLPKFVNERGAPGGAQRVRGVDMRDAEDERRRRIIDLPKFANPDRDRMRGGSWGPGPDERDRWGPGPGPDRWGPPGRGGWDGPPPRGILRAILQPQTPRPSESGARSPKPEARKVLMYRMRGCAMRASS
jgi:hypothetical protein